MVVIPIYWSRHWLCPVTEMLFKNADSQALPETNGIRLSRGDDLETVFATKPQVMVVHSQN